MFNSSRFFSSKKAKDSNFFKEYSLTTKVLGKGAYAEVRLGSSVATNEPVAVKIIDKHGMSKNDMKKLNKEVNILKALKHKHVVRVFQSYDEKDAFMIVMEYVKGGELFDKIVNEEEGIFNEKRSRVIIRTIAEALKYCKDQGVIHRDIKPENILLTPEEDGGDIKIADFNLSKKISKEDVNFSVLETMCGTPNYVAPEVLSGTPYDYKCDIWSLGVITYLLLSGGYLPFFIDPATEGRDALLRKVRKGNWKFQPDEAWANVSPEAKDLLKHMLKKNPAERYTYDQVLGHPWFKTNTDNMQTMIDLKPLIQLNEKRKLLVATKMKEAVNIFAQMLTEGDDDEETDGKDTKNDGDDNPLASLMNQGQDSGLNGFNQTFSA